MPTVAIIMSGLWNHCYSFMVVSGFWLIIIITKHRSLRIVWLCMPFRHFPFLGWFHDNWDLVVASLVQPVQNVLCKLFSSSSTVDCLLQPWGDNFILNFSTKWSQSEITKREERKTLKFQWQLTPNFFFLERLHSTSSLVCLTIASLAHVVPLTVKQTSCHDIFSFLCCFCFNGRKL